MTLFPRTVLKSTTPKASLEPKSTACQHLGGASTVVAAGHTLALSPDGSALYFVGVSTDSGTSLRQTGVHRKPRSGTGDEVIFRSPAGLSPLNILPFPDGKELLILAGNDNIFGSAVLELFRVNVASHDSQKVGEISGSPTGPVWNDPGKTLLCSRTVNSLTNIWEYRAFRWQPEASHRRRRP